jgi:N6-L-threonylcarbamoyladenine synthase
LISIGIETSCDETSVGIVNDLGEILAHVTYSQFQEHKEFGGVVPEIAARAHLEKIEAITQECLLKINPQDISCVCATAGPGLIGGVVVGAMVAKSLSFALGKPYVAVNHLEGHALTVRLCENVVFPYLLLLASGGHTQILIVRGVGDYEILGSTIDDAIGETFDKTAKILGFEYPGGPMIEKLALNGDERAFAFTKPLYKKPGCNFSLSGLKTAMKNTIQTKEKWESQALYDLCASFQKTICDVIEDRLSNALKMAQSQDIKTIVVSGGVAANKMIRSKIQGLADTHNLAFIAPPLSLCTDNGAMIAWAGLERFRLGLTDSLNTPMRPRWPLEELKDRKI